MSGAISLDIDVYGAYARLSAVADWLERVAVGGKGLTEADLADYIDDNGWRFPSHWIVPGAPPEAEDGELEQSRRDARSIFGVVEERAALLGSLYPFKVESGRLGLATGMDFARTPYAVLWSITIAHAYGLVPAPKPTRLFEKLVAECLNAGQVDALDFGEARRDSANFPDALVRAGTLLRLPTNPDGATRSARAMDENADTLCHWSWGDLRPGLWGYVGQATCGKSESWDTKMMEVSSGQWREWLGTMVEPMMFLAVPHHVEGNHMRRLVEHGRRIVLDRIRLAKTKSAPDADEENLVEAVLAAPYDAP